LGEVERQIRTLRDQFEEKVAVLKQQWLEASQPMESEWDRLRSQLERFYWAHLEEVLAQGRKSVDLAFGRLGSRLSRSVVVEDMAVAQQWLEANGLERFLRTSTDVDREAIRSTLLAPNAFGTSLSHALLSCPVIRLQESEQFWYEVSRNARGNGPRTEKRTGTTHLPRRGALKRQPATVAQSIHWGEGHHDRTIQQIPADQPTTGTDLADPVEHQVAPRRAAASAGAVAR